MIDRIDDKLLLQCGDLQGHELLSEMIKNIFHNCIALVSSFGAHSAILLDMVSRIDKRTHVVFLDTGKLFPETLRYQQTLVRHLKLENIRICEPAHADVESCDPSGDLWASNPDQCCYIRKVRPLHEALKGFDCWITGRKRYQGGLRTRLETIEFIDGVTKINPLALWSQEMVREYFIKHDLPYHPLYENGYLSLGCMPCTSRAGEKGNERDGRWPYSKKAECGIHGRDLRNSDY